MIKQKMNECKYEIECVDSDGGRPNVSINDQSLHLEGDVIESPMKIIGQSGFRVAASQIMLDKKPPIDFLKLDNAQKQLGMQTSDRN